MHICVNKWYDSGRENIIFSEWSESNVLGCLVRLGYVQKVNHFIENQW